MCVSFPFLYSHTWINYLCEIVGTCYMRRRLSQSPIFSKDSTGRALPQMIPDRTFNNLNKMLYMSLPLREFFSRITAHRIFFRPVSLAGIFFGNCQPTSGYFWWSVLIYAGVYCITTIHLRLSQLSYWPALDIRETRRFPSTKMPFIDLTYHVDPAK